MRSMQVKARLRPGVLAVIATFAIVSGFVIVAWRAAVSPSADLNHDNRVDVFDLSLLLSHWSQTGAGTAVDINADGAVGILDLSILLSSWDYSATPTPVGELNLPRIPWEGGSAYWQTANGAQFAKTDAAGWDDPAFFPISVFLGQMQSASTYRSMGINTYQGMEHNVSVFPLSGVTDTGMYVMPQQTEWTLAEVGGNANVVAWFLSDECEMGYSDCVTDWSDPNQDEYYMLNVQKSYFDKVRTYNDGRFAYANFGNGITRTFWAPNTMDDQVQLVHAAGADKYTYTSPSVDDLVEGAPDWPQGVSAARSYSYGWQADQMRRFQDPARLKPVWTFIETARPYLEETGARTINPDQIEGAVWSAIIHEARGISYLMHNNDPACGDGSACDTANSARVVAVNAQVKSLASVLNTQSYYNSTRVVNGYTYYFYSFDNGTDTMLKTYGGSAYVFAGLGARCNDSSCSSGTADSPGTKNFAVPVGVTGTSVEVVGENRTIPISNGGFSDNFAAEYSHHIYRIRL